MHKHLRRLERIWIDAPIYFITTCTRDRRPVLARDGVAAILLANGVRLMIDMGGLSAGTLLCLIMSISSVDQNATQRLCRSLCLFGRATRAARSMHAVRRGQRPRLQRCGNAVFLITCCVRRESYTEKWNYVTDNPVRAGLVSTAQEWKYAGEIETLML